MTYAFKCEMLLPVGIKWYPAIGSAASTFGGRLRDQAYLQEDCITFLQHQDMGMFSTIFVYTRLPLDSAMKRSGAVRPLTEKP